VTHRFVARNMHYPA